MIEDGKLDIGLIGKPDTIKELDFKKFGEIEDVFISSPSYLENLKVREGGNLSDAKMLECGNIMLLDEKNITRLYIENYFVTHGIRVEQILEVSSMDLLIEFAKTGLGIACVIKEFVKEDLMNHKLVELKLPSKIAKREVGFAYKKDRATQESLQKFIHQIEGFAAHHQKNMK